MVLLTWDGDLIRNLFRVWEHSDDYYNITNRAEHFNTRTNVITFTNY